MAGTFGTKEFPVILDISQLIERVAWITGPDILMVRVKAKIRTGGVITTTIEQPIAYNGDLFASAIHDHDAFVPTPIIQLPTINKDMIAHSLDWNKPPLKKTDEGGLTWFALLFFNLRTLNKARTPKLPDYEIKVRFQGSTKKTLPETIYWAYADPFANPFEYYNDHPTTTGAIVDGFGHFSTVVSPKAFSTSGERNTFIGWNAGSLPPWVAFDQAITNEQNDMFQWEVEGWAFKRRKEFPVNTSDFKPSFAWETDDKTKDYHKDSAGAFAENDVLPAYTVTIRVNLKTLKFTLTKA